MTSFSKIFGEQEWKYLIDLHCDKGHDNPPQVFSTFQFKCDSCTSVGITPKLKDSFITRISPENKLLIFQDSKSNINDEEIYQILQNCQDLTLTQQLKVDREEGQNEKKDQIEEMKQMDPNEKKNKNWNIKEHLDILFLLSQEKESKSNPLPVFKRYKDWKTEEPKTTGEKNERSDSESKNENIQYSSIFNQFQIKNFLISDILEGSDQKSLLARSSRDQIEISSIQKVEESFENSEEKSEYSDLCIKGFMMKSNRPENEKINDNEHNHVLYKNEIKDDQENSNINTLNSQNFNKNSMSNSSSDTFENGSNKQSFQNVIQSYLYWLYEIQQLNVREYEFDDDNQNMIEKIARNLYQQISDKRKKITGEGFSNIKLIKDIERQNKILKRVIELFLQEAPNSRDKQNNNDWSTQQNNSNSNLRTTPSRLVKKVDKIQLPITFIPTKYQSSDQIKIKVLENKSVEISLNRKKIGQAVTEVLNKNYGNIVKLEFSKPMKNITNNGFFFGLIPDDQIHNKYMLNENYFSGFFTDPFQKLKIKKGKSLNDKELRKKLESLVFHFCVSTSEFYVADSKYENINTIDTKYIDPKINYRFHIYFAEFGREDLSITITEFAKIDKNDVSNFDKFKSDDESR